MRIFIKRKRDRRMVYTDAQFFIDKMKDVKNFLKTSREINCVSRKDSLISSSIGYLEGMIISLENDIQEQA